MSNNKLLLKDAHAEPSKIIGIQFGLMSTEEIRKSSVVKVDVRDMYHGNKPVVGSLVDPRMGTQDPNYVCPTDNLDYINTPGYHGHIELAVPIFYVQYIKDTVKWANCVCCKCSKLLISKTKHQRALEGLPAKKRWDYVVKACKKVKSCGEDTEDGCYAPQPTKIRKDGLATIIAEWTVKDPQGATDKDTKTISIRWTPEMLYKRFMRISDDDVNFAGFNSVFSRPENMICHTLLVPPPAIRPSVKQDSQQRSEDDLTHILMNIIKINNELLQDIQKNAAAKIIEDHTAILQFFAATLVNNSMPGVDALRNRSSRPYKSIISRLGAKGGRMRGNLMAKRVDYSARSVITGEPNLSIEELGIPMPIAMNLTMPIVVTATNVDFLTQLVRNGPDQYPGAKILKKAGSDYPITLKYMDRDSIVLEAGDEVHRHLLNGDMVLFNRQPTLHRMSMQSFKARIMTQGNTFRFNVGVAKPFNADYDGDEMNAHVPQNVLAAVELRLLSAVPYQIISPANHAPIIGPVQDNLLGAYIFTGENVHFTAQQAMNLMMTCATVDVEKLGDVIKSRKHVTSFDILSQITPPVTLKYKTKGFNDEKDDAKTSNNVLEIRNGQYVRGRMDKGVLSGGSKSLIQRITNDYSNHQCVEYIDNLQNIVTQFMKTHSFSVGISDLISNTKTTQDIARIIDGKRTEVKDIIDQIMMGTFINNTGRNNNTEFENQVLTILSQASGDAGKVALNSLGASNRFVTMVKAGSKGNENNIAFMTSCLGQQTVEGKRIPDGFQNRTLPHFPKYDEGPMSRGFVTNSYVTGLSPTDLFYHAMAGRVGLIDTAVKSVTWETPVIIIENGAPVYTEIGRWIDGKLDAAYSVAADRVEKYTERNMELLKTDAQGLYIPTADDDGRVTWGEITAITRHDPGDRLYEVTTAGGRTVTVTESKSLIVWDEAHQQFLEKPTPDIKRGDYLPVTSALCAPPTINTHLNMVKYLPKTKYLYGSDFYTAVQLMNSAMENRQKIPANWWETNNGTEFTLPFNKKASLQRTVIRSNVDVIQKGCIYAYHAKRMNMCIKDTFELNEYNGKFIGIYLAEGNACKSKVCITNSNDAIKSFVKEWFASHNIEHTEVKFINKIGGTTNSINGTSSILADFLKQFVGHRAENKYVPVEAFTAPDEFIIGLLSGYYSGDGTVSKNSVDVGSASKRLIENISSLCNRLGIFGKLHKSQLKSNNLDTKNIKPTYRLSIRSLWGKKFAEKIQLLDENKQTKLKMIKWTNTHINFKQHNDVVLDPISEIRIIGVEAHPKVYDLTIPSTLNFGLANGLQVRDTSSTGYIQRRLIKGLEDCMVRYDHTVRSNKGKIIQYSYGDDGIDPLKVETQNIPLVGMSIADIYAYYNFPDVADKTAAKTLGAIFIKSAMTAFKKQAEETAKKCQEHTDRAIAARDDIIKNVFRYRDDNAVNCPVAFAYIIGNIQGQVGINQYSLVDITPLEVFAMLEATMADLEKIRTAPPTALFKALYYYYLAPKELLLIKRFNRAAVVRLLDTVKLTYKQAIVAPGEMVGPVAAQSIGEISTQMTLNSFVYETPILVRNRAGVIREVELGRFATEFIDKATRKEYYADKDTTYAELDDFYEVPSCDEEGRLTWERIEAVTRHPVINADGSNTMLKVTTDEEREVIATKAKSFLKLVDGRVIGVNGDSLKVGDYLPVSNMPLECTPQRELNLREFLPATKYLYSTDLHAAFQCCAQKGKGNHNWWQKGFGVVFTLPYKNTNAITSQLHKLEAGTMRPVPTGCIYMPKLRLKNEGAEPSAIPEKIPLDYQFGYLLGAYAAEGCITKHQVSISNNAAEFYAPIVELCQRWKLTTKQYVHENKIKEGWTSSDIRIYNTLLCHILNKFIGKLSHNKFISDRIIYSNRECVLGFLDAYISGDGCIPNNGMISAASVSKQLLEGVQKMLNTLGVYSYITKGVKRTSNNRGTKPENIHQPYILTVSGKQNIILAGLLKPTIDYKRENLKSLLSHEYKFTYNKLQEVVPNEIDGEIVFEPRHETKHKDLLFNKIVSIEEVPNTTPYAYDLTVERTRNFDIGNRLILKDTFHNVGILSKTNATRGVPRIDEILSLSENIKSPSLTVFLKPEDRAHKDHAQEIMYKMEHTTLGELVKTTAINYDPDDLNTLIDEDRELLAQYKEFETMVGECANVNLANAVAVSKSKWLLRMEMDPETMLEKNITMDDIHFTLNNIYKDQISCVFSDYNADKLVFRVRMTEVIKQNAGKTAVNKKPLNQFDQIYILKNFQDNLLKNVVIRGVKGIKKVAMRKVKNQLVEHNGSYVTQDQWVLDTTGSNLLEVLALDYIDRTKTYSNDIIETFEVLGIEAARQAIFNELVDVIKFDGTYIDYHHFAILCDRMSYSGDNLISIYRHGIKNDNIGVLAKASFEETGEMLMNAAKHGELDVMTGVSANVMCGQEGLYGTNAFKVLLDMSEVSKMKASAEYKYLNREKELADMFKEGKLAADADECAVKNLSVQNGVANIAGVDMGEQNDDYNPF